MTDKPVIFLPGDPDAETGVPPIVMLANGPALRCSEMRLTVGVRKRGAGEDLLLSMASTGGGNAVFCLHPDYGAGVGAIADRLGGRAGNEGDPRRDRCAGARGRA